MAEYYKAKILCHLYSLSSGADLGYHVLYTLVAQSSISEDLAYWDNIDSDDENPTMPIALGRCGLSNFKFFINSENNKIPTNSNYLSQVTPFNAISASNNVIYTFDDPSDGLKIVPEGLNGKYILVSYIQFSNVWTLKWEYYDNDNTLILSTNSPYVGVGTYATQWGRYRISTDFMTIPFPSVDKSALNYCLYSAFIEYYGTFSGLDPKPVRSGVRLDSMPASIYNDVIIKFWGDYSPSIDDEDNPYWDGGTSEEGGGDGNFSDDSDNPEADDLPEIGAIGTGFATIFKPSLSQLRSLSELFWNSNVFTFLQNLVENITDMFTSLAMVPFEVTAGSTVSVTWLGIDTAISLTLAAKQYYEFNMGSINLAEDNRIFTSGSALDYSPFSTLGIYLPFIGYQELDIDECRGAVINLRYRIDILSGTCVAIIKVAGRDIYQFTGNCLTQIPITNENMQSLVSDAVNVGIAMAGAQAAKGTMSAVEDNIQSSGMSADKSELAMAHANTSLGHSEARLASATANVMSSGKPSFKKSGAISSSASMLAVKQPYLFLTTPRQSIPERYQRYCGFPSNITGTLGSFSGYTVVEDIRLNDLVATSPEVAEIYQLLKQGVIV